MSFTSVLVSDGGPGELLARCRLALGSVKGRYNFGVVYLSDHLAPDADGIVEALGLITGVHSWVGGVALGVCGTGTEVFDQPAISVLLGELPDDAFRVFGPLSDASDDPGLERWRRERAPYLGLVHADPRDSTMPGLVESLGHDGATYLVGGLLSSRGSYPHVGATVGEGTASGALFTDSVTVVTRLSQGCSPIGPRRTVTRAEGPRLLELDGKPALAALASDIAARGGNATDVHVALPRTGSDTGDYLVRNLLGVAAAEQALVVGEQLQVGDALMFCRRDAASARQDLERMLGEISRALPGPPRAGIYVSCLARGLNLFEEPGLETRLIRERLGDFPLAGFFANGEVAGGRLYGYTGVLTLVT